MYQLSSRRSSQRHCRIVLLSFATLLLATGGSNADMLISQTSIYDVFVTTPVPVGSGVENLQATTLYVVNTSGDWENDPVGFDGVFLGYSGVAGVLHQQDGSGAGLFTPTVDSSLLATAIDTHFLNTLGELLVAAAPFETRNVSPSAEPSDSPPLPPGLVADTTFGDRLSGTFALSGGAAGPTWQIAQLVAPSGTTISLNFAVSGLLEPGPAGDIQTTFTIPEPTTLTLMVCSAAALLRKRRSKIRRGGLA